MVLKVFLPPLGGDIRNCKNVNARNKSWYTNTNIIEP